MNGRGLLVISASLAFFAACGDEAPEWPNLDAGSNAGGHDAGQGPGLSETSEALCSAAMRYKAACLPSIYYESCYEVFQHFDKMDPIAERALTECFLRECDSASLGACYAEAIHAVEPDWIDEDGLADCVLEESACYAVVRGDFADCFSTAEACDSLFGESYCWHIATFTPDRRGRIRCDAGGCADWQACIDDIMFGD